MFWVRKHPIILLTLLAITMSLLSWYSLEELYARQEIEGEEVFINTLLLSLFYFTFPLSLFAYRLLSPRILNNRKSLGGRLAIILVCFVVTLCSVLALALGGIYAYVMIGGI